MSNKIKETIVQHINATGGSVRVWNGKLEWHGESQVQALDSIYKSLSTPSVTCDYFTTIPIAEDIYLYCDENGLMNDQQPNPLASAIFEQNLVGPVLCGKDLS